jgi:predicted Zn-dependent protease
LIPRFFLILLIFVSCTSKDGDVTLFSPEDDVMMGKQASAQIGADPARFPVLDKTQYSELYREIQQIRDAILRSESILHRDEFVWDINIIHDDTVFNAFCTPGGFIYVYTGLIRYAKSEDELAGILAHEIAHADLRHSTDQLTRIYGLRALVQLLTGGEGAIIADIGLQLAGLQFSRSDEAEADRAAVGYLNSTHYHPARFADFFKRMEEHGASMGPLQFLSTHPNPENRVIMIETWWQESGSKKGKDHTMSFRKIQELLP